MRKHVLVLIALLTILATHGISQIVWDRFSPMNTGDNPLNSDRINFIQRQNDTLVFGATLGISFKYGNLWEGSDAGLSNLENIRDYVIASDGKLYIAVGGWGLYEISGPNYVNNKYGVELYNKSNSILASDSIIEVVEEGFGGKIYVGTIGAGIYVKDGNNWSNLRSTNSGLLNDTIYDMIFRNNKLYIGTNFGLSIYNGTSFTNFIYNGTNGLSNRNIICLYMDNNDTLWAGTWWGVNKFDGNNSFTAYLPSDGMLSYDIQKITQDTLGNYWFLHTGGNASNTIGLTKYDGTNFTTTTANGSLGSIPYSDLTSMEFDSDNNLWLGTEYHGALKFDGSFWKAYDLSNSQSNTYIRSVCVDNQDQLWAYPAFPYDWWKNENHVVSRRDNGGQWSSFAPATANGVSMRNSKCLDQIMDDNGRHWFASLIHGVFYEQNGVYYNFDTLNSIMPENASGKLTKGINGDVWITTYAGLVKVSSNLSMSLYNTTNSNIGANKIFDVAVDSSGNVWAATEAGLSKFNGSTWTNYDTLDFGHSAAGTNPNYIYRVEVAGNQDIWANLYGAGLLNFNGSNWTLYGGTSSNIKTKQSNELFRDSKGDIWNLPRSGGVQKFSNGSWIDFQDTIHISNLMQTSSSYTGWEKIFFYSMTEDSYGDYYFASWGYGVIKLSMCLGLQNNISIAGDSAFCQGDSAILMANNSADLSYEWFRNGLKIPNENKSNYTIFMDGNYSSKITDTINACSVKSKNQNITVNSSDFNLSFTSNDTLLNSPPFNVTFVNQTPQLTQYSYFWDFGDGNSSQYFHPFHQYQYNGIYDVKLTATNNTTGCSDELQKDSFVVANGGNSCNVTASITPSGSAIICENDSILLTANTGAAYTYHWIRDGILIPNADSSYYYAKQTGHYVVVVNDGNCSAISQAFVLNHYPANHPQILSTGSLQPCTNDSMLLGLNSFYQSYQWSNGDTTPNTWISQTGYYFVDVVDQFGCNFTSSQFQISNSSLQPPGICIIGVDSASGKNRIIWERQNNSLIDSIVVFRETNVTNVYDRIGSLPYTQSGVFIDPVADPTVRAWRYKLAAVDSCGALSLYSPLHKTVHLTINAGLNGSWNLIWDDYIGFPINSYFIYRGTSTNNMQLITQVPGNLNSFTDLYPPTGTVYYQIAIQKINGCYPDSLFAKANTNYNISRSNTANSGNIPPIYFTADFNANINTGIWPVQVEFSDLTSGMPDSWKWNFGDGNTSIEKNPIHTYNNTGLYTVSLEVCNGDVCDTIVKTDYINVLPNGMVEIGVDMSAKLFPNPNDGNFTLEIADKTSHELQLHIYNSIGEMIYQEAFTTNGRTTKNLKLNNLANGVYFVNLNTQDNIVYRTKVVIHK